jgi:hypothetical protein
MATNAPEQLVYLANAWEKLYASAAISGIIGDKAHAARGGYHISIQDQPATNYSVTRADDKAPPGDWPRNMASAIDMTLSTADIKKCHIRLREAWKNRANDPRMKYINAWNGWDGEGDAGRYDVITGNVSTATADHKWHIHLEIRRRYVNSRAAMDAILSILKGETLQQFLEEDVAVTAAEIDAIAKKVWDVDYMPSGDEANPTWQTKTLISYYLRNTEALVKSLAATVASLSGEVATIKAKVNTLGNVDVDEAALAAAVANDATFINALATAIAAKVQTGQDVKAAVREVFGQTRLTVG